MGRTNPKLLYLRIDGLRYDLPPPEVNPAKMWTRQEFQSLKRDDLNADDCKATQLPSTVTAKIAARASSRLGVFATGHLRDGYLNERT